MKILLMRHGEAVDAPQGFGDGDRWLTAKGRRVTREVAAHVAKHTPPAVVWTSPLVRAVQTAEILVDACELEDDITVVRELATGDVHGLVDRLRAHRGESPLALVGHEPTLSVLVTRLLADPRWPGFDKSGVCALRWDHEHAARFEWALAPRKLRVVTDLREMLG